MVKAIREQSPRTEIVAISKDSSLDEVLETIRQKGHSRIPVYEDTIDTILGVLYAKDLLRRKKQDPFVLTSVMRKSLFVPESKPVRDLLREFQQQKVHIATVLDEYGGPTRLAEVVGSPRSHISAIAAGDKGIGDALAAKIERKTGRPPGWLDEAPEDQSAGLAAMEPAVTYMTMRSAVEAIGRGLAACDEMTRESVEPLLRRLATSPDQAEQIGAMIVALVSSATGKRRDAA